MNTAAKLFDRSGLSSTAEILTRLLEKLAHKKEDEPDVIEFESLLEEPKDEPELGEQIIEMRSLFDDKKKD